MLEAKSCIGVRYRTHTDSDGGNDLNRTAKVLYAELIIAEKTSTHSRVESHETLPATEGEVRNNGRHQGAVSRCCQVAGAGDESRFKPPSTVTELPRPRESEDSSHVSQVKIILLFLSQKRRFASEA